MISVSTMMTATVSMTVSVSMSVSMVIMRMFMMDFLKIQSMLNNYWIEKSLKFFLFLFEIFFFFSFLKFTKPSHPILTFFVNNFTVVFNDVCLKFIFQFSFFIFKSFFDIQTECFKTVFGFDTFLTNFIVFFEIFGTLHHFGDFIGGQSGFFICNSDFFSFARFFVTSGNI